MKNYRKNIDLTKRIPNIAEAHINRLTRQIHQMSGLKVEFECDEDYTMVEHMSVLIGDLEERRNILMQVNGPIVEWKR